MPVTRPRLTVIAVAAGAALLLLGVLYWKSAVTVHAPPATLALLKPVPARPAPAVVFTGEDGKLHNLAEFKGRVVLVNLWAPWCGPCVKELPALAALQKALPDGKFTVVAVDVGRDSQAEAREFLNSHGAAGLHAYLDSNAALLRAFGGYGLPMSILIGKDGNEIARAEGAPDWSAPESVSYLKWLSSR
jgi:thiol-disulfide isomerase/thioredoxin